jgi:hypothetical protein
MSGFAEGPVRIEYQAGDGPSGEVRVLPGTEIEITLKGAPAYGWSPVSGVAPVLVVVSESIVEGTVRAVLRAESPGTTELRSTSSFTGDRFGPQTRLWKLRVCVTGAADAGLV